MMVTLPSVEPQRGKAETPNTAPGPAATMRGCEVGRLERIGRECQKGGS